MPMSIIHKFQFDCRFMGVWKEREEGNLIYAYSVASSNFAARVNLH